jgi:hypothetical protein
MARDCVNLTTNDFSEYGTYCFQHSNLTNPPITFKELSFTTKLKPMTVSLGNLNKPFDSVHIYSSSRPEKKVRSSERKIPVVLDSHKMIKMNYETMSCCVCENKDLITNKMKCGHLVCRECLGDIRHFTCPLCEEEMKGPLLTENVLEEIGVKYREDINERGEEDETMKNLALLGYNPEDF